MLCVRAYFEKWVKFHGRPLATPKTFFLNFFGNEQLENALNATLPNMLS